MLTRLIRRPPPPTFKNKFFESIIKLKLSFVLLTAILLFSILLFSINALALNSSEITHDTLDKTPSELLQLADQKRSSDNQLSIKIIKHLTNSSVRLSAKEKEHLMYLQAYQHAFQANYEAAIILLNKLITSSTQKTLVFRAHFTLINIYSINQNWQAGLQHLNQTINLSSEIEDNDLLEANQNNIVVFYNQLGQYQQALNYLNKINDNEFISIKSKCARSQLYLFAILRLALEEKGNALQQAELKEQLAQKIPLGIKNCKLADEALYTNIIRSYQAELYLENKQSDSVIAALQLHEKEIIATNYPILITGTYNLLAQAYWIKKDNVNTKKYALLAKENSQLLAQTKQTVITYKLLYQLAEQAKDYANALQYHKKYSEAKQTVLDEIQAKHLAFQLANYNDLANKQEIEQLNQKNKLLNTQHLLFEQQQENSLLLIILLLSFLAAFSLWSYRAWLTQQRLKLLTEFDSLTNVFSRNHFIELANKSLKQYLKTEQPLTCILLDLDYFKKINDDYGHAVGDEILKEVAKTCQKISQQYGIFGRLGGEEFAFILPGCDIIIAEDIAKKCLEAIAKIDYQALGLKNAITASIGISDTRISGFKLRHLLTDADSAMFISKEHGRNCFSIYR